MRMLTCSLALLLLTVTVVLAYTGKCNNETVTCIPTDNRCAPPPPARQCCSRKLVKCGSCTVCLKYLEKNEGCESFAPTNAVCRPPLRCGSGLRCV